MLETILIVIGSFLAGVFLMPGLLFIRSRRDPAWDDSNMSNMYRIIAHLATRPSDFGQMQYPDGRRPFWYINKDEISEVVKTSYKQSDDSDK